MVGLATLFTLALALTTPKTQTVTAWCKVAPLAVGNSPTGGWSVVLDPRTRTVTLTAGPPQQAQLARIEPAGGSVDPTSCRAVAPPKVHHAFVLTSPWSASVFSRVSCGATERGGIVVRLTKTRGKPTRMAVSVGGSPLVIATIARRSGGIAMAGDQCIRLAQ